MFEMIKYIADLDVTFNYTYDRLSTAIGDLFFDAPFCENNDYIDIISKNSGAVIIHLQAGKATYVDAAIAYIE